MSRYKRLQSDSTTIIRRFDRTTGTNQYHSFGENSLHHINIFVNRRTIVAIHNCFIENLHQITNFYYPADNGFFENPYTWPLQNIQFTLKLTEFVCLANSVNSSKITSIFCDSPNFRMNFLAKFLVSKLRARIQCIIAL